MAQNGSNCFDSTNPQQHGSASSPTVIINTDDINFRTINIDNNVNGVAVGVTPAVISQPNSAPAPPDTRMEPTSNFQRRTAEGSRLLRNNIHLVIEEIRPYVEQARSNLLNRQNSQPTPPTITANPIPLPPIPPTSSNQATTTTSTSELNMNNSSTSNNDAFVIVVDGGGAQSPDSNISTPSENGSRQIPNGDPMMSPPSPTHNNNNNNADEASDAFRHMPETRTLLVALQKYSIVVIILSAKAIYDHHDGILMLLSLFLTFSHANSVFKQEVMKQGRRSIASLLVVLMYIVLCIFFLDYIFDQKLYANLVFAAVYTNPLTVSKLLWTVTVSDFMLKLITVVCKIFVIFVPGFIMPFQRRGKLYLLLESLSQFYRSLLPIQPWLWFLLNSYQGAERVLGVLLAAVYMVAKGADLASKLKLIKTAIYKLLQNVNFATAATKEQLRTAGEQCAICHDMFNGPVALQPCKHVFCETCVCAWLDRERTCPLCRALVSDDPEWRDGSTAHFIQIY